MHTTSGRQYHRTVLAASVCYTLSCVALIFVLIGNVSNVAGVRGLYFYRLELANIIPESSPNSQLLNSVARSLGLHDFYQVGLWNFCEGYNDEGITYCSPRKAFYWFNPVDVIMSELLAGAQIALPMELVNALTLLRIASKVMFALFLIGIILNFLLIFASLLAIRSRAWSIPLISLSLISTLMIGAATILGTVMSVTAKYAVQLQSELNIRGVISSAMLAAMWIASILTAASFFMHCSLGCCLRPRRALMADVVGSAVSKAPRSGMMEDEQPRRSSTGVLQYSHNTGHTSGLISRLHGGSRKDTMVLNGSLTSTTSTSTRTAGPTEVPASRLELPTGPRPAEPTMVSTALQK
ncbi:SUR7 family protein pun1 [Ceratocystis platani]|uniref:SUR7 family protein pun1 n=1 Tax=Ceratocystis fimbriata f. sp. platani TaxID=88771 RepID=A0A0F8BLT0_CERFI|nr:SUR7 family protein pun1 [Ceratocystis platani]